MLNVQKQDKSIIFWSIFIVFTSLLIFRAWVTEDAYITFRTLDHFINGNGLRWNLYERVQAYTHPLWLFVLTPFYYLWGNIFITSIAASVTLTVSSIFLVIQKDRSYLAAAFVFLLLISKSFIDFSTSGLENCLSHFLFALFLFSAHQNRSVTTLSLIISLSALNRLDSILIYTPFMIYTVYHNRQYIKYYQLVLGFSPLIIWECFSLIYYGFLLPNTYYSKLNAGIPLYQKLHQGFHYFGSLFLFDISTALILTASIVLLGGKFSKQNSNITITNKNSLLFYGAVLYLFYILYIGGDYMAGRFFTLPYFILTCLLYISEDVKILLYRKRIFIILGTLSLLSFHGVFNGFISGITNERYYYTRHNTLFTDGKIRTNSRLHYRLTQSNHKFNFVTVNMIGLYGYINKNLKIIDAIALSDPFLSKISQTFTPPMPMNVYGWRPGHHARKIPEGYIHALQTGDTDLLKDEYKPLYKNMKIITQDPIWSIQRFKIIFKGLIKGYYFND